MRTFSPTATRAAALSLAAALALAAPAAGQEIPGGDASAFDQYVENVPDPRGDEPSRDNNAGLNNGEALPDNAEQALNELGQVGEETAALAQSSGPKRAKLAGDARGVDRDGDGGIGGVIDQVFSPNAAGVGFILPLILIGVLVAGLAYAVNRRLGKPEASV
jgi:hypothetical protein